MKFDRRHHRGRGAEQATSICLCEGNVEVRGKIQEFRRVEGQELRDKSSELRGKSYEIRFKILGSRVESNKFIV